MSARHASAAGADPPSISAADIEEILAAPVGPAIVLPNWLTAISQLRAHSVDVVAARAAVEVTSGEHAARWGAALPQVSAVGSAQQNVLTKRICDPISLACVDNGPVFTASIGLTQPVVAPALWAEIHASGQRLLARERLEADTQRTLALRLLDAVGAVIVNERLAETARLAVAEARERAELVRKGVTIGALSTADVLRADSEIAVTLRAVVASRAALQGSQQVLGGLLGEREPVGVADGFDLESAAGGCPATEPEQRDDVVGARLIADASKSDVTTLKLGYLPSLNFATSFNLSSIPFVDDRRDNWIVGGSLVLPLWDGGALRGRLRAARARALETERRFEWAYDAASLERIRAAQNARTAAEAAKTAKTALRLTSETERMARASFSLGSSTVLDLMEAGRLLRESQAAEVVAEVNARVAALGDSMTTVRCSW